jgi:uncharacterized protein
MLRACLVLSLVLLPVQVALAADIPKPPSGQWVVDLTSTLQADTVAQINEVAADIDRQGHGQLMVVLVDSVSGREPREFALELFNRWGIGNPGANDGALLFVSLQDRAAEILLGDDVDGSREIADSDDIMNQVIVPAFRDGNPSKALVEGSKGVQQLLASSYAWRRQGGSSESPPEQPWYSWVGIVLVGGCFLSPVVVPVFTLLWNIGMRVYRRRRSRRCFACQLPRRRLSEAEEDEHLSASDRAEEQLGSVDYDVWLCDECGDAQVLDNDTLFNRYVKCSKCTRRGSKHTSRTLVAATYSEGGLLEITERCALCRYEGTFTKATPRRTRSRSSSRSSFGSSSSSSSRSSGSSSGGGRSSGGGSSGRW